MRQATKEQQQQELEQAKFQQQTAQLADIKQTMVVVLQHLVAWSRSTSRTEVVNPVRSVYTPDVEKVVIALSQIAQLVRDNQLDLNPIQQQLDGVTQLLAALPKQFPEAPEQRESVSVSNLGDLDERFAELAKDIKGLKLVAEAPQVNVDVPEPRVIVQEADLSELRTPMLDVLKAVKSIQIPEPKPTDVTGIEERLDESNKKLDQLIEKPIGGGGGGGGGGLPYETSAGKPSHVQLTDDGAIPVGSKWHNRRFDPDDDTPNYLGLHTDKAASPDDEDWKIFKFIRSGSNATQILDTIGAWSSRGSLF